MARYDPLTAAQQFTVGASLFGPNLRCERCGTMLSTGTTELLQREHLSVVLAGMAGHWLGCNDVPEAAD